MASLIINQSFCEPSGFLDKCLDILCASKGIFKANSKTVLKDVYDDMRTNLNSSQYIIYPVRGSIVSTTVNKGTISKNNMIYAGHDFPVWLNDPTFAKYRVMVVSQDPRRNDQEMGDCTYEVGISTPFGLHSMSWRSNKTKGFVHWLFDKLLAEYGPQMSVYYTDVYKFRGVGPKSVLDTSNFDVYKDILRQEIELFEPNVVLLMGNEAQEAYNGVMNTVTTAIKPAVIETPHPNARIKDKKYWGKYEMAKFDIDSKIEIIINEIKQKLNK